jgi:hypothetical protein
MRRRQFLAAFGAALAAPAVARGRQTYDISEAERLVAAIQDGGKIVYWVAGADAAQARLLGQALRALRAPLNEILASRGNPFRQAADAAFADLGGNGSTELDFNPGDLLRTSPPPGHNRILVAGRGALETATGRKFPASTLPDGALAVFLPAAEIHLLGVVTADRVIRGAQNRGALPR